MFNPNIKSVVVVLLVASVYLGGAAAQCSSNTDPLSCASTEAQNCGWCIRGGTELCVKGSLDGPNSNTCDTWDYVGCLSFKNTTSCFDGSQALASKGGDVTCAWCGPDGSNGQCVMARDDAAIGAKCDTSGKKNYFDAFGCLGYTTSDTCYQWKQDGDTIKVPHTCGWCSDGANQEGTCLPGGEPGPVSPNAKCDKKYWDVHGCTSADTQDTCYDFKKAGRSCGWCGRPRQEEGACVSGNDEMPFQHKKCSDSQAVYDVYNCLQMDTMSSCKEYSDKLDLKSRMMCGWCGSTQHDEAGVCMMGSRESPIEVNKGRCPSAKEWDVYGCLAKATSEECYKFATESKVPCGFCGTSAEEGKCIPGESSVTLNGPYKEGHCLFPAVWDGQKCLASTELDACHAWAKPAEGTPGHYCGWCKSTGSGRCLPGISDHAFDKHCEDPAIWDSREFNAPKIESIDPLNVATHGGQTITVKGQNLALQSESIEMTFKYGKTTVKCEHQLDSPDPATEARCITASSKKAVEGAKMIVRNLAGTDDSSELNISFYDSPIVTSIEPSGGNCLGQDIVTVTGKNFGEIGALVSVMIGPVDCGSRTVVTEGEKFTCLTGQSTSEGLFDVIVTNPLGPGVSEVQFSYTLQDPAPPATINLYADSDKAIEVRISTPSFLGAGALTGYELQHANTPDFAAPGPIDIPLMGNPTIVSVPGQRDEAMFVRVKAKTAKDDKTYESAFKASTPASIQVLAPKCDLDCSGEDHGSCDKTTSPPPNFTGKCSCSPFWTGDTCADAADMNCKAVAADAAQLGFCDKTVSWEVVEGDTPARQGKAQEEFNKAVHTRPEECDAVLKSYFCAKNLPVCNGQVRPVCTDLCKQSVSCLTDQTKALEFGIDCRIEFNMDCTDSSGYKTKKVDPPSKPFDWTWVWYVLGGLGALVLLGALGFVAFLMFAGKIKLPSIPSGGGNSGPAPERIPKGVEGGYSRMAKDPGWFDREPRSHLVE